MLTKENYRIYQDKGELFNVIDRYIDYVHRISLGNKGNKNVPVPCFMPPYAKTENSNEAIERIVKEVSNHPGLYKTTEMALANVHAFVQCGVVKLNTISPDGKIIQKVKIQRLEATNLKWKSQLIVSFMMGFPLPAVIFILGKDENGEWTLVPVDGQQRTIAVSRFINNDFAITGTGTCFDGLYFRDLPRDLQQALLSATFECRVIDATLNHPKYIQALFYKYNSTANNLNAMEIQNAMFSSTFSERITALIHDFGVSDKKHEYALNKLLFPAGNPDKHYDRMNEKRLLIYAYAMARSDLKVSGSTQESYITALLSATSDADNQTIKEGANSINEIIRVASLMLNVFGENFANQFFYKPMLMEGDKVKVLQFYKDDVDKQDPFKYNEHTGHFAMKRFDDKVCRKNFVSVFFVAYHLYKIFNTTRLNKDECIIARGVCERIFLSNEYQKLLSGGPANLKRSRMLLKAVLTELIKANKFKGRNEVVTEQHRANCIAELDKLSKVEFVNWEEV